MRVETQYWPNIVEPKKLVDASRTSGQEFRWELARQGSELAKKLRRKFGVTDGPSTLVVMVPRAGIATGIGVTIIFPKSRITFSNSGELKHTNQPSLPKEIVKLAGQLENIIIIDEAIVRGDTLSELIRCLARVFEQRRIRFFVMANFATSVGMRAVVKVVKEMPQDTYGRKCYLVIGHQLDEYDYYLEKRGKVPLGETPRSFLFIGWGGIFDCGVIANEDLETTDSSPLALYLAMQAELLNSLGPS